MTTLRRMRSTLAALRSHGYRSDKRYIRLPGRLPHTPRRRRIDVAAARPLPSRAQCHRIRGELGDVDRETSGGPRRRRTRTARTTSCNRMRSKRSLSTIRRPSSLTYTFLECSTTPGTSRNRSRDLPLLPIANDKLRAIIARRGITTEEEFRRFVAPCIGDLHDPATIHGIGEACERIERAVRDRRDDPHLRRLRRRWRHVDRPAADRAARPRRGCGARRAAPARRRLRIEDRRSSIACSSIAT